MRSLKAKISSQYKKSTDCLKNLNKLHTYAVRQP